VQPDDPLPVVASPDDITLVVAGGHLPIAQHAYLPTWGFPACRIHRVVRVAGVREAGGGRRARECRRWRFPQVLL